MPAPPGHRCDQTSLPARPQGATFTGQPAACSRYTAVTLNKPLDFERGGQFFRAIILHAVTRNHRRPAGRRGHACSHADLRTENSLIQIYFIIVPVTQIGLWDMGQSSLVLSKVRQV